MCEWFIQLNEPTQMQNLIFTYIQGLLADKTHRTTDRNIGQAHYQCWYLRNK